MKIVRIVLTLIFLIEGVTKILGLPFQINAFDNWGYERWFMYLIGSLEILGAIGLLMRPTRLYSNIGLLGIMAGAFYTHIRNDPPQMMSLAVLTTILLVTHLYKELRSNKQVIETQP